MYWMALAMVPGIGPSRFQRLVEVFGSPAEVWRARPLDLAAAGLDARSAESLLAFRKSFDLDAYARRVEQSGARVLTLDDAAYPERLKAASDPPPVLYMKGELLPADAWPIAVVGTRRASAYGRHVAERIAGDLARSGVTIVSGLARGIDSFAHRAAIEAGGRTIAVLGNGIDRVYPPENARLAAAVAEHGALLSEFPLGTPPDAMNFPRRNRVIAGLSMGVLVVEAPRESGAMITADLALEQGRDVYAVPGSVFSPGSVGPHQLLKDGAKLVTSAEDILEELHLDMVAEKLATREVFPENEAEAQLLRLLGAEPVHVDELSRTLGLPASAVSGTLAILELKGLARSVGSMYYVRGR